MAQFDVYANPGGNQAAPFLVQIQGSRTVLDRPVFANPFDLATVPAARLGHPLCRLSDTDQDAVLRALDDLLSRA